MTRTEIIVVVVLLGAVGAGAWYWLRGDASTDFAGDLTPYYVAPTERFPSRDARRQGKVLAVDVDARTLDPIHDRLPPAIRARSPDEVGSVALVRCEKRLIGSYGYTWANGYANDCDVHLIAWPSRQTLAELSYVAQPPETVRFAVWNHTGVRPAAELAKRIAALPDGRAGR